VTALDHTVIYDADCGMCRTLLALVLRADTRHRLRPLALGTPEAGALLHDLSHDQQFASWHLIAPDGTRTSAGAAAPKLLRLLPHGAVPAALLATAPHTTERAYRWVAGHRDRLGPLIPDAAKRRATESIARRCRSHPGR
jgi:predicted DCC family thiol-disulfide oxidoreductase YuxK